MCEIAAHTYSPGTYKSLADVSALNKHDDLIQSWIAAVWIPVSQDLPATADGIISDIGNRLGISEIRWQGRRWIFDQLQQFGRRRCRGRVLAINRADLA